MKKKVLPFLLALALLFSLSACSDMTNPLDVLTEEESSDTSASSDSSSSSASSASSDSSSSSVTVKTSPDKYTWYIKNYVGKNCAAFGYTSLGGNRMDTYGDGYLRLIFMTADGSYVDIDSEEELQQYVVTGQSLAPNTELKLTFLKDEDGEEYSNLVDSQSYEQIILSVKRLGDSDWTPSFTKINPSPDKYTCYIRDYVGLNLASCGYTSLGEDRMDSYSDGYVQLVLVPEDGSYLDPTDEDALKNYVITGQSVAPNTELTLVYLTDSDGVEYSNLIDSQSIEEIELTVRAVE